jgi:hypothetical protein
VDGFVRIQSISLNRSGDIPRKWGIEGSTL